MIPWYATLRRLPGVGKWLFLLFDKRRNIESALHLIAAELAYNANQAARTEPHGTAIRPVDVQYAFSDWSAHKLVASSLRQTNAELWQEVVAAYDGLRTSQVNGLYPPTSDYLSSLAARLNAVRY